MSPPTTDATASSSSLSAPPSIFTSFFAEAPAGIASLRKRLFSLEESLELPRDQWDRIWPYVDNIWVQNKKSINKEVSNLYYLCRLHSTKTWVPKDSVEPRRRQRTSREAVGCGMKFKAIVSATSVIATRTGTCESHCHDLEYLDRQKKNSGILTLAARQVAQGYNVAAVATNITTKARPEDRVLLKELGGHWVNLKDIHNAAAAYKAKEIPEGEEMGPAKRRLAVKEILDSLLKQYESMEVATAGWEEGVRNRFLARWIAQLRARAGEVLQLGVGDMVEGKEIPVDSLERRKSQQARRVPTKEQ